MSPSPYFNDMLNAAHATLQHAYAPYSHLLVGTCFRAEDNTLYSGCNVENASYGLTLCAENVALGKLISTGKRRIVEVVLVSSGNTVCPPCGRCRQLIREFADDDVNIHLVTGDMDSPTIITYTINTLLPAAFGPAQLVTKQGNT